MTRWSGTDLTAIGDAEEVTIASLRRDDTWTSPRIVWIVRVVDELYLRSVNGRDAAWFRSTQVRRQGRLAAARGTWDVEFMPAPAAVNGAVDLAYRHKYRRYAAATLDRITSADARSTTLCLDQRTTDRSRR